MVGVFVLFSPIPLQDVIFVRKENGDSHGKQFTCNAGDLGSISGSGRVPGEGNGNSLQYSDLENSMDRGVWQVTVHRVANSPTGLSD